MTIQSFDCRDTESLHNERRVRRFESFEVAAQRKLAMLDAAPDLLSLGSPPGNRLEALKGDRSGQYSIRINDQYRICFVWTDLGPAEVEIVDYH